MESTTTEPHHPGRDELRLVDVLHALSDPVRLQLVEILDETEGALACVDIPLPVGKSTASHHLRVLREAGVARCRMDGTRRYYSLRREDLEARFPGVLDSVLRSASSPA
ncbi:MAG: ArsR family transcriptional regulator [Acidimicrobiales bacterium]|nr:ArsR family transcriptional regulator [Acidimicrobiales bacterium]